MKMKNFKLIMWKHYRLRRYHWIATLFEFLLPILGTYFLIRVTSQLATSTATDSKQRVTIHPAQLKNFRNELKSVKAYYSPSNYAIDDFMNRIKDSFESCKGFANEAELETALENNSTDTERYYPIGISFRNIVSNDSLPNILSYALRTRGQWTTGDLYDKMPLISEYLAHSDFLPSQYLLYPFVDVQLILNENFIQNKTNQNDFKFPQVEIEKFPYPEYIPLNSSVTNFKSSILGNLSSAIFCGVIIYIITVASYFLIPDIMEEKDSGVKELMKISGLDERMIWFGWFVHAIFIHVITFLIVTFLSTSPFNGPGSEIFRCISYFTLLFFIIIFCIASYSFCFMFSSFFHKANAAASTYSSFILVYACLIFYLIVRNVDKSILILCTLVPVGAFVIGFNDINFYEKHGYDYTWSSFALLENNEKPSLSFCMGMLVLDTFVYLFLTYYISSINPGKFGVRKSPLFIFQRLFTQRRKENSSEIALRNLHDDTDARFFESSPSNLEATIRIKNLHKQFGSVRAVNGVNLNIYPGEMTALLGHNGAGKTTTISIMTGLSAPSAGSIHFKNMNIFENMESFRQKLGMCPQENRLMPYLSVMDHLLFFGRLKGFSLEQAETEANEYLTMMEMQPKKNALPSELSGGMKRKLCLSIALMGKSEVLILDEPTSGMDVQSRRKFWDLLLELRGKRTIIFTTHYMEEADALGDRIAIMNGGFIVCHGTPIFLKKVYDTGYELTITKSNDEGRQDIDQIIQNVLPATKVEFESSTEMVCKLPLTETDKFPALFRNLESEKTRLGITNIGIAATTMEQVFLKVGSIPAHDAKLSNNTTSTDTNGECRYVDNIKGISLIIQQLKILLRKKLWVFLRNPSLILTHIVLSTFILLFFSSQMPELKSFLPSFGNERFILDLSMRTYLGSVVMMRSTPDTSNYKKYVEENQGKVIYFENSKIEDALLKEANRNLQIYNKDYITAFEFSPQITKILYNPVLLHSLPISITTYSNILLQNITGNDLYRIESSNHPVSKSERIGDTFAICPATNNPTRFFSFFNILWIFSIVQLIGYFFTSVNMERIDGFYHIQIMSNISPFLYWASTLVFDSVLFFIIIIVRIFIYKIIDHSKFPVLDKSFGVLILIVILYEISELLFIYIVSCFSQSKEKLNQALIMLTTIGALIALNLKMFAPNGVLSKVILLVPSMNFSISFSKLMAIIDWNLNIEKPECKSINIEEKSYFVLESEENPDGLMLEIGVLLIDVVLYGVVLSLINMGYVQYWINILKNYVFGTETTNSEEGNQDVQLEYHKVQQCKRDASTGNRIALLVDGLCKNYLNRFKPLTAVSNVNFHVESRECFGLLGVNGAGKSTTFKMLTGEILPTLGDSSIEGVKFSSNRSQYLSMAGYCPQTNCFIEVLTGKEMLSIIATVRGIHKSKIESVVNKWITIMGLGEFQNERCGTYSGGNKRKLCAAMSLIGDPRVVFLDEPTSGVDPVSKRSLYYVMGQSKKAGQAVILTSHSMEECESLCDRITIMVAGVMKCIGTAQHLKKMYAQGFSVLIKLNNIPEFNNHVETLKKNMGQTFIEEGCVLKDEHKGLLYYQIKDTSLPWSVLFEKMEAIKVLHQGLVEDYVLSDTTMEEVFMSFTKDFATSSDD